MVPTYKSWDDPPRNRNNSSLDKVCQVILGILLIMDFINGEGATLFFFAKYQPKPQGESYELYEWIFSNL